MLALALRFVVAPAKALVDWLTEDVSRLIIALLLLIVAALWYSNGSLHRENGNLIEALTDERNGRLNDREQWQEAQREAERLSAANIVRVETLWRQQLEQANETRIALNADYQRRIAVFVRNQAGTDRSRSVDSPVPGAAAMPDGPLHDPAVAVVPVTDLHRCAAAFATLTALIDAWHSAASVDTTPQ